MIDKLLEMIGLGGPEHEGKVLAKDARNLVDIIHGQSGAERLSKIAQTTREMIDEVHERVILSIYQHVFSVMDREYFYQEHFHSHMLLKQPSIHPYPDEQQHFHL